MSPSKIFFYFCLIFITSVFLASFVKISQPLMLGFFILGLALIAVFWEKKKIVIAGFYILFFLLGFWRYQQSLAKIIDNQFPINEAYNEKAIIVGSVLSEPDIRISNVKLVLKGEKVIIGNKEALFSGKVLITSAKYPEYKYGDKLKVTGKISLPPVFEDFNYKDYLAKQGIQAFSFIW